MVGEEAGHGAEAAEVLRAAGGEEHLEARDVGHERLPAVADAGGDGLEEGVVDVAHVGEEALDVGLALHAQLACAAHLDRQRVEGTVAVEAHGDGLALVVAQGGGDVVEGRHGLARDADHAVAGHHAGFLGCRAGGETLHHEGDAGRHELLDALVVDALHEAPAHGDVH